VPGAEFIKSRRGGVGDLSPQLRHIWAQVTATGPVLALVPLPTPAQGCIKLREPRL
jgi:hypothetical protein